MEFNEHGHKYLANGGGGGFCQGGECPDTGIQGFKVCSPGKGKYVGKGGKRQKEGYKMRGKEGKKRRKG